MYVSPNFSTKKQLREAVQAGKRVVVFAPGLGSPRVPREAVEGPHYPEPHRWYAQVDTVLDNGEVIVTKVR